MHPGGSSVWLTKMTKKEKNENRGKKIIREIFQDNFPELKDTKPLD